MQDSAWANPISDRDRDRFIKYVRSRWGPGADTEDVTMRWAFLVKASDRGNGDQVKTFDVTSVAANDATAAGATDAQTITDDGHPDFITSRTQDPVTGGDSKTIPRSMLIMLGGLGGVVQMPLIQCKAFVAPSTDTATTFTPAAVADDALGGIHAAFDAATLELTDGRTRRAEIIGHEFMSYGASRVGVFGPSVGETLDDDDELVTSMLYSGQVSSKMRGWRKIKPTVLGADSQVTLKLSVPRSTNWPIRADSRFRVDIFAPALVGRMTSASGSCDLPDEVVQDPRYGGGRARGGGRRMQPRPNEQNT